MKPSKFTCIEAFCGAGGLALGMKKAGFKLISAFDNDPVSIESFNLYHGKGKAIVADAKAISGNDLLPQSLRYNGFGIDLFSGGPPCQGFSKQKRGAHLGDDRNGLVLEFARLVHELQPKSFLLENVSMFGQKRGKSFVDGIKELLSDYDLFPNFYNSADYGLAQTRERFVIVGFHESLNANFSIPSPTVEKWKTVKDIIGDLPEPPEDYSVHSKFPNHQRARVTPENIKRFSFVPQGGDGRIYRMSIV